MIERREHETYDEGAIEVTRAEEELRVGTRQVEVGKAHIRKDIDVEHVQHVVPLDAEAATIERVEVDPANDSGQVETLPDGSISVPVFREQLVVQKRLIVTERIIVRKHRHTSEHVVDADLRRERVSVDVDDSVADWVTSPGARPDDGPPSR